MCILKTVFYLFIFFLLTGTLSTLKTVFFLLTGTLSTQLANIQLFTQSAFSNEILLIMFDLLQQKYQPAHNNNIMN